VGLAGRGVSWVGVWRPSAGWVGGWVVRRPRGSRRDAYCARGGAIMPMEGRGVRGGGKAGGGVEIAIPMSPVSFQIESLEGRPVVDRGASL